MYFIVSSDGSLNLAVSLSLPSSVCGFRRLNGIAIFSEDAFDGQNSTLGFTREMDCPLFQLLLHRLLLSEGLDSFALLELSLGYADYQSIAVPLNLC